jgi:hypothetical protein
VKSPHFLFKLSNYILPKHRSVTVKEPKVSAVHINLPQEYVLVRDKVQRILVIAPLE